MRAAGFWSSGTRLETFSCVGTARHEEQSSVHESWACRKTNTILFSLVSKHSDDIDRPNQMACNKCARICDKAFCYDYPMMDTDVIRNLSSKKETLDKMDEAECLTFVCEQHYMEIGTPITRPVTCIWSLWGQGRRE
jgi:hypothetical protein